MSEQPRRWFQIHLSTAVVLMFVAGGLMWLNFRARFEDHVVTAINKVKYYERDKLYGFPMDAFNLKISWSVDHQGQSGLTTKEEWIGRGIMFNVLAAFAILSLFAFAFESVFSRIDRGREVRKP